MKNLLFFILGTMFISLVSFGTAVSIMTVKPQFPKETIVKDFWGSFGIEKDMKKYMLYQIKKGFIVKSFTLDSEHDGYQRGIVVMEKY